MPGLKDSILEMENLKKNLKKAIDNSEDIKNGVSSSEEEEKRPDYILYNGIIESVINILSSNTSINTFSKLTTVLSDDQIKSLIEVMAICMTISAHNAIITYDSLLKGELDKQFDHYGDVLNQCIATVNAHDGVLKVLRKTTNDIKNEIEELKDKT